MSKITIPLLMIFAAIGLIVLVKLDRDEKEKRVQHWPSKLEPKEAADDEPEIEPIDLEPNLSGDDYRRRTRGQLTTIRRLPLSEGAYPVSFLWPTDAEDRPALPDALGFAKSSTFEAWKSYVDEEIGFYYPDAPGVRVEVVGTTDPLPLLGETMLPPESGVFKKYRITAGDEATLCVISLARSNHFDDAPRAPHPEVFYHYTPSGGGMLRTAFSADGQVRRAELLGKNLRVSLLDWPHLAVHQDVYLRIAAGIKLPQPYARWTELKADAISNYGFLAKLGMLEYGASISDVTATLGQADARDDARGVLQYFHTTAEETFLYTLRVKDGRFIGFGKDWREKPHWIPTEGSIRWMVEKTDYRAGEAGGIGYNLGALSDADTEKIFDRVMELAPTAGPGDWPQLCQVIVNLSQHGLRDPRIIEIARAKLESPNLDPEPALMALVASDSDEGKGAIADHMMREFAAASLPPDELEHFYTLIAYLGEKHPATKAIIDRALQHESSTVRELGFRYCAWLPDAIPHLEAGLHDDSIEVRRCCASAFAESHGDSSRHPKILEICLDNENDEQVKLLLKHALKRLRPPAGS